MEIKCGYDYVIVKEVENPFNKRRTEHGLIIPTSAQSQETGEVEQLEQIIKTGIVTHVGPLCTVCNVGDLAIFDKRSTRIMPLGVFGVYRQTSERNIMTAIPGDDPELLAYMMQYDLDNKKIEEEAKANFDKQKEEEAARLEKLLEGREFKSSGILLKNVN